MPTNVIPVRIYQQEDGTFVAKPYGHTVDVDDDLTLLPVVGSGGAVSAINNAVANRLVTIGTPNTELDAEANLTFNGTTLALTGALTVSSTSIFSGAVTITSDAFVSNGFGLVIGHPSQLTIGGEFSKLQVLGTTQADSSILLGRWDTDFFEGAEFKFFKGGTAAIDGGFIAPQNDELVGTIIWLVDDGVDYDHEICRIQGVVDDLSIGPGVIGGKMQLRTARTDGIMITVMTLFANQSVLMAEGLTVGSSIVSDTNRTDNLGTPTVAWLNLFVGSTVYDGATSGDLTITVPAVVTPHTLTLPGAVASAGQVLTDAAGNGILSWATPAGGGAVTALNNQAENRLVTIGSPTTELDGEANATFDGTTLVLGNGTGMVIGNATALDLTASQIAAFQVIGTGLADAATLGAAFRADSVGFQHYFLKSRDTVPGSFTIVQDNDTIGRLRYHVDDGVDYGTFVCLIDVAVDDPSPAVGSVGCEIIFQMDNGSSGVVPRYRFGHSTGLTILGMGLTIGGDIDVDADSAHDIGSIAGTPVRFANVYTDAIGDSAQSMTHKASINVFNNFLRPAGIDATDVGATSLRFRRGHFNQIVTVETFLPTTASVRARNTTTAETDFLCLSLEADDANAGADNDTVYLNFISDTDTQVQTAFAEVRGVVIDATNASPDGANRLRALSSGSMATTAEFGHSTAGVFQWAFSTATPLVRENYTATTQSARDADAATTIGPLQDVVQTLIADLIAHGVFT